MLLTIYNLFVLAALLVLLECSLGVFGCSFGTLGVFCWLSCMLFGRFVCALGCSLNVLFCKHAEGIFTSFTIRKAAHDYIDSETTDMLREM